MYKGFWAVDDGEGEFALGQVLAKALVHGIGRRCAGSGSCCRSGGDLAYCVD